MPRLKSLSGSDVVAILALFGFERIDQRGSHVKLRRVLNEARQTLTIPMHQDMDKGTLRAIYRQSARFIPESELRPHLYSE